MNRRVLVGSAGVGILMVWQVLGVLYAQQHPAGHPHPQAQTPAAPSAEGPRIFCPTLKTGQLCPNGTSEALALAGAKREAWIAAIGRYNKAVDEATKQLQAEAKPLLTPAELAEVERWFAQGLNPQINRLLAAPSKPSR